MIARPVPLPAPSVALRGKEIDSWTTGRAMAYNGRRTDDSYTGKGDEGGAYP
jgi:hypothetical protein